MKRLLILIPLLLFCGIAQAQVPNRVAFRFRKLPTFTVCQAGDVTFDTSLAVFKGCTGTNTVVTFSTGSGGSPGGSDTYVQFNDGSAFGGISAFTLNKTALSTSKPTLLRITTSSNIGSINNSTTNKTYRNLYNTSTPTASMSVGGTFSFIGSEQSVDVSGLSVGDSALSVIQPQAFGSNGVATGTITINDTDGGGGVAPVIAAVNGTATITTSTTASVDGVDGEVVGGRFSSTLTHPSATGGVISAYGVKLLADGTLNTSGTHEHYGAYAQVAGAGLNNFGFYASVTPDATNNAGVFVSNAITAGANNYAFRSASVAQSVLAGPLTATFVQQSATRCFLAANQTNATTTMANVTGCSPTVTSGRKYTFKIIGYLSDSLAADGAKLDFDGGSATMTNFRCHCTVFDTALGLSAQTSALATDFTAATLTGDAMAECHGTFEPSGTGTFIPRFAQVAHTTGTLTIYRGSHLLIEDMP